MGAYRKTVSRQLADLDQALAAALAPHQDASERLCEIPGVSVRIAQHIIAETGPSAEVFESAGKLASWVAIPFDLQANYRNIIVDLHEIRLA